MTFQFDENEIRKADALLHGKGADALLHGGKKKEYKYHETLDFLKKIKGEIFATMFHKDGTSETREIKNIVVERCSVLIARVLIGEALPTGATFQDIYGQDTIEKIRGITHLAMGLGKPFESYDGGSGKYLAESGDDITDVLNIQGLPQEWDKSNPPGSTVLGGRILEDGDALWANIDKSILVNEIGRKKFQKVQFLNTNFTVSAYPTHIIELECEFGDHEVVGGLMEMGLFGGTVEPFDRDYIAIAQIQEYGDMVNFRTFKIWHKSSTDRLQIRWRITIPLNDAPMEPAD
jgi:hypothetical protein